MPRGKSNSRKGGSGQSVVELLVTYSWAILIVAIFVSIVLYLASTSGQPYITSSCSIEPLLPCTDTAIGTASGTTPTYYVEFVNNLQSPMNFTANSLNITTTGIGTTGTQYSVGNCYPQFALTDSKVVCYGQIGGSASVAPPSGTKVNTYFTISYQLCSNQTASSCTGSVYKTSGSAVQTIAPANIVFYQISFQANNWAGTKAINGLYWTLLGTNGTIYLNGVPYAAGQNAVFVGSGSYVIYPGAPSGTNFYNWSANSLTSTIANAYSANTLLTLTSNVILTMNTTGLQCNTCYNGGVIGVAALCPAQCPNRATDVCYSGGCVSCPVIHGFACT